MTKRSALILTVLLFTGCTYNVTLICGEGNNAKQKMEVVKDIPVSTTIPLLK